MFARSDCSSAKLAANRHRRKTRLVVESLESRNLLACLAIDENWIDAGGGCQDLATGLIWSPASGIVSHPYAITWASNLVEGGQTDWRLATKDELLEAAGHGANTHIGSGTSWSSTKQGKNFAWGVALGTGESGVYATSSYGYAHAVRGTRNPVVRTDPNVRVFSPSLKLGEPSGSTYFQLALDTQPLANVTIPLSSSDTSEGTLAISQVTFTPANWNVPQWVQVTAVDDALLDGTQSFQIVTGPASSSDPNYAGLAVTDVQVQTTDNERALIAAKTDSSVSESGDTGSFNVRLGAQPLSGPVYVSLLVRDPDEISLSTTTLTFTAADWNTPQTVTVTGLPDGVADGDVACAVHIEVLPGSGSSPEFLGAAHPFDLYFSNMDIDGVLRTYSSGTINLAIPSPGTVTSSLVVLDTETILDADVSVNIAHTYIGDLTVWLVGPNGGRSRLHFQTGGSADNLVATYDVDQFNGLSAAGTWTLEVNDAYRSDRGTLVSWSLEFRTPPSAAAMSEATDAALLSLITDDITPAKRRAGLAR